MCRGGHKRPISIATLFILNLHAYIYRTSRPACLLVNFLFFRFHLIFLALYFLPYVVDSFSFTPCTNLRTFPKSDHVTHVLLAYSAEISFSECQVEACVLLFFGGLIYAIVQPGIFFFLLK